MEILYIISLILLGIAFMIFKKSEEKLNFVKWLIIFIVSNLAYNIVIGMVLGLLNITAHIWLLSLINVIVAIALALKAIKTKDIQKYTVSKFDIVGILLVLVIFAIMFVKDLYIFSGDITHAAMDSAIHYRAAKHYSENMKIFINVEDPTFFNFNVMQTGAYINDGIFMNIAYNLTGISHEYLYQAFESIILLINGLAFYAIVMDKIKTKRGFLGSFILFALYMYGYPYNNWIFGFSYLAVGVGLIALSGTVVELLFSKENIKRWFVYVLLGIVAFGIIFSYCLFVPIVFAAICIYCFLKGLTSKEEKKYLKIFSKTTLIVFSMLIVITIVGIAYLFIPTFFIEGQTDLVSALKINGGFYGEKYRNFVVYIPFALIYFGEILKRIKNKNLRYVDVFSVCVIGFLALMYLGMLTGFVSPYYMIKIYSLVWLVILAATVNIVNEYVDKKLFRLDFMLLILLYAVCAFKFIGLESIVKIYCFIILAFYMVLPELLKEVDFDKIKEAIAKRFKSKKIQNFIRNFKFTMKVSAVVYVTMWGIFVAGWVWIKAGHVIGEVEKHSLPELVSMYYEQNCEYRKLLDLNHNINVDNLEILTYAREELDDMDAVNLALLADGIFNRTWATALLDVDSDEITYNSFIEDCHPYPMEDLIKDEAHKYLIKITIKDQTKMDEMKAEMERFTNDGNIKVLLANEHGFVAEIINREIKEVEVIEEDKVEEDVVAQVNQ